MARIARAQAMLRVLVNNGHANVKELFPQGPVVEWQLRLVKRLVRERWVDSTSHGYRVVPHNLSLLRAATESAPAIVELLWPERARDVIKHLQQPLLPVVPPPAPEPEPEPAPPLRLVEPDPPPDYEPFKDAVVLLDEPFKPNVGLMRALRDAARTATVAAPPPDGLAAEPKPEPGPWDAIIAVLREQGPLAKRDLQNAVGGKRQNTSASIERALAAGEICYGMLPEYSRPRVYLQEQAPAAPTPLVANAIGDDAAAEAATADATDATDDSVDDATFKATVLKYTVIYGQNFIAVAEHFRLMHEQFAQLHAKLDALAAQLERQGS